MKMIIVAALSRNRVLGKEGELLWNLPDDEEHLLSVINDGWLLTGRTSYETAQGSRIFDGRNNVVVLTSRKDYQPGGAQVAHNLNDAYRAAKEAGADKMYILGGARVYQQTLEDADQMILTIVDATFDGDAIFPDWSTDNWKEMKRVDHPRDEQHAYPFSFIWLERTE